MKLLNDRAIENEYRNTKRLVFGGRRRFTTRASHVNDAGSIGSPLMQSMEIKIKEELNAESVIVKDANGDGRHVSIDVISSSFEGKSAVNRQRMVYKAIWEELQSTVHAVDQMTTKTPEEAAKPRPLLEAWLTGIHCGINEGWNFVFCFRVLLLNHS
ncbi:hypothetical protein ACLB2K_037853 [Fragaria x ananassa]